MSYRPEYQAPPEIYYGVDESKKYTSNTRNIHIQRILTERCIELCTLPMLKGNQNEEGNSDNEEMGMGSDSEQSGSGSDNEMEQGEKNSNEANENNEDEYQLDPKLVLDLGCGSGLSGEILSEHGHEWIGTDISQCMLDVAVEREVDGDLIKHDMGHGLPFRAGTFDAAISVSAIQWLCNQDKTCNNPAKRLKIFFESLYSCLKHGAKAALQFYPENAHQAEFIQKAAIRAGFTGGLLTDFPNSAKKKKHYLVLFCGVKREEVKMPEALKDEKPTSAKNFGKNKERLCDMVKKGKISKVDWIKAKKEKRRRMGKQTARDSKFTGRKRGPKF